MSTLNKLALALTNLTNDQRIELQMMLAIKLPPAKAVDAPKGKGKATARVVKHQTMLEAPVAKPVVKKPELVAPVQGFMVTVREPGLIVVVFSSKEAYTANKGKLGDAFRYSGQAKEWRASLAWVTKNAPDTLKALGLAK